MNWFILVTVIGLIIICVGAVLLPCGIIVQRRVSLAEHDCTQPVSAKVIDRVERATSRVNRQTITAWFPIVEYEWNGRTYHVEAGMGMTRQSCPKAGDMLTIMVNPNNPGQVHIPNAPGQNLKWMTIAGVIMLAIGVLMIIPLLATVLL